MLPVVPRSRKTFGEGKITVYSLEWHNSVAKPISTFHALPSLEKAHRIHKAQTIDQISLLNIGIIFNDIRSIEDLCFKEDIASYIKDELYRDIEHLQTRIEREAHTKDVKTYETIICLHSCETIAASLHICEELVKNLDHLTDKDACDATRENLEVISHHMQSLQDGLFAWSQMLHQDTIDELDRQD